MNDNTPLYRQVVPAYFKPQENGMVAVRAFFPRKRDEGRLSVHNGDGISAEGAYRTFMQIPRCNSAGVVSVFVRECQELEQKKRWELPVCDDPHEGNPHHVVIDFNRIPDEKWMVVAELLRDFAAARGWAYGPVLSEDPS